MTEPFFSPQPKKLPVRLSRHEKAELKKKLYFGRAKRSCETCEKPLKRSENGTFFLWRHAHLSHIKGYAAGGGDTEDNVKIECPVCHLKRKHGPKWSYLKEKTNAT